MDFFASPWDAVSPVLVWILGLKVSDLFGRKFNQTQKRSRILYSWHTVWCIAYLVFSLTSGADSLDYYNGSYLNSSSFSLLGTSFIFQLTALLSGALGLSYLSCFLVYNIIGTCGYLAFDSTIRSLTADKTQLIKKLATLVVFLPSLSFWSSAIGKDPFAFTASCLALWSALDISRRKTIALSSIALMLLVRPHIAGIMILSFAVSLLFSRQLPFLSRLSFLVVFMVCLSLVAPLIADYVGISQNATSDDLNAFIESRQGSNLEGGSSITIEGIPLPFQMISYLLRPSILEINSFFSLISAIENLLLLVVFLLGINGYLRSFRLHSKALFVFLIPCSFFTWAILAATTANLGIAARQKWMLLPMLVYLSLSAVRPARLCSSDISSSIPPLASKAIH
ncbi:hypothetical protein [Synechococcus sp. 8F6]|uniref:hypothetical protein n=1 Tax=Synechococcus sp. 8F6 TaxID=2025606 RepID=UPI0011816112|nr:hypothetical protein [Synechococcus sp. 8F6]